MVLLRSRPNGRTSHVKGLLAGRRGPGSPEFEFDVLNSTEYDRYFMDFRAATIPADEIGSDGIFQYAESSAGSTDPAKLTPTAARPSHIKIVIDDSDPSRISLLTPAQWNSAKNPFLEVAFDVQLATNLELAIGFAVAIPGSAGPILGDIDTPTLAGGVTDAAVIGIDTAETLKTAALVTRNNTATTKVNVSPVAAPFGVPSAATQVVYRVELRGQKAFAFINGSLVAESGPTAGPRADTLVAAVINIGALSDATKDVHIDYIDVGQERTDQPF